MRFGTVLFNAVRSFLIGVGLMAAVMCLISFCVGPVFCEDSVIIEKNHVVLIADPVQKWIPGTKRYFTAEEAEKTGREMLEAARTLRGEK